MTHQRGYTLLEILAVVAMAPLLIGVVGQSLFSSQGLAERSRAELRAHEELRRNLEAVANVVRGADVETFGGFDDTGSAWHPTFARVLGVDAEGPLHDGTEELFWRPVGMDVDGIEFPGEVVHRSAGIDHVVARHVPRGGFRVRLEGGTLLLRIETYYVTSSRHVAHVRGETAVAIRN